MKFLIGLLAGILITGVINAQHSGSPAGHVSLGVKAGVNLYNVYNDNGVKYDLREGYHFGLLGHIHFNTQFALQPEIVYSAQGAKYTSGSQVINYNLDYINIPVLLQYMFDNGFRFQAGPQIGLLVGAKSKNGDVSTDFKNDMEAIDFSLSMGVSYVFPSTGFGLDLRYNVGLNNINKDSSVTSTNRGFQFGGFYIFGQNAKKVLK